MRALLVGSVNLDSAEQVFSAIADHAGDVVDRMPDGESGVRKDWFEFQVHVLSNQAQLEGVGDSIDDDYAVYSRFKLRNGVESAQLEFGPLGYAEHALASYKVFKSMKAAGKIRQAVRFQVSLPTPTAVAFAYLEDGHQAPFEQAYERHLLREIAEIGAVIPGRELAIQWDVAIELAMLEGVFPTYITGDVLSGVIERLLRLGDSIPEPVELGYHLCYGNRHNKHWKEPEDTAKLVAVANGVSRGVKRTVTWVHLPVPIERDDAAYFQPLRAITLQPNSQLALGLLHKEDGIEGAHRRISAARGAVSDFALATECGMGREPSESITGLLDLHAQACHESVGSVVWPVVHGEIGGS